MCLVSVNPQRNKYLLIGPLPRIEITAEEEVRSKVREEEEAKFVVVGRWLVLKENVLNPRR
jgi:hypothetical protein